MKKTVLVLFLTAIFAGFVYAAGVNEATSFGKVVSVSGCQVVVDFTKLDLKAEDKVRVVKTKMVGKVTSVDGKKAVICFEKHSLKAGDEIKLENCRINNFCSGLKMKGC